MNPIESAPGETYQAGSLPAPEITIQCAISDGFASWLSQAKGSLAITTYQEDEFGIFARQFNASAEPLLDTFRVDTIDANNPAHPSVGMDADGDFVVAWTSRDFPARRDEQVHSHSAHRR